MSVPNKKRGRPKGSGINDAAILQDIASLIATNTDMKPTTAIKALGYSDPSTIRRLRDKYKSWERRELHAGAKPKQLSSSHSPFTSSHPTEARSAALQNGRDKKRTEPISAQPVAPATPREPETSTTAKRATANDNDEKRPATHAEGQAATDSQKPAHAHEAKRARRKPDFAIPDATHYPRDAFTPFTAALTAWQEGLRSYQELSILQQQFMTHWVNSPTTQFMIQQQLALSKMMLSGLPHRGFFQQSAQLWASQPQR
ncbi:MAG: hypothetical protein AAFV45_14240 [Pseudomonadota bacterium]